VAETLKVYDRLAGPGGLPPGPVETTDR
jgi:hypothetical protein